MRIDLEDAPVSPHGVAVGLPLADRARERFFGEQVEAGLGGGDTDQGVPVRGRGDVDRVDVPAIQDAAPVRVRLAPVAGFLECPLQMVAIHVADRQGFRRLAVLVLGDVPHAHAAGADDRPRNHLAGRYVARSAQHVPRHDVECGPGLGGATQEPATRDSLFG